MKSLTKVTGIRVDMFKTIIKSLSTSILLALWFFFAFSVLIGLTLYVGGVAENYAISSIPENPPRVAYPVMAILCLWIILGHIYARLIAAIEKHKDEDNFEGYM